MSTPKPGTPRALRLARSRPEQGQSPVLSVQPDGSDPDGALPAGSPGARGAVDWDKFRARLSKLRVVVSVPGPGEPVDPHAIVRDMARVQNARSELDDMVITIETRLGLHRSALLTETHQMRVDRSSLESEPGLIPRSGHARRSAVELMLGANVQRIGILKSRIAELESALKVVKGALDTLGYAKETLNAMRSVGQASNPAYPQGFARPAQPRPRF